MRLLITGVAGFIGSHFAAAATRAGHMVYGVDLLTYAGRSANIETPLTLGLLPGDICDRAVMDGWIAAIQPDAIVHLAAESHVARSIDCRDEFLRTNVAGTLTLLEAALDWWRAAGKPEGFRFLHVSTDEVYGSLRWTEAPWTEASPYAPNNPYAASKAASDHLVRSYHRTFGLPTLITHSSNNYGPKQHPEKLIPTLIAQAMRGEPMTLHGDGQNVRDWLHVEDHCAGLLDALARGRPGETYNFGGQCERSNRLIANLVHSILSPTTLPEIAFVEDRPGNDQRYATDVTKAARDLQWGPGPQIGSRIGETVRWYVANPDYAEDYGH